jgi:hypothetical protein
MDSTLGRSTFSEQSQFSSGMPIGDPPHIAAAGDSRDSDGLPARIAAVVAENGELRAELEQVRAEKARMAEILSRLAEVVGSKSPDRLMHDVRNILNERELYRALADSVM